MDIDIVIRYLDDETTYQSNWSSGHIRTYIGIQPKIYIQYAQRDVELANQHGFINALSNMKRALFCQIDRILKLLGYYSVKSDVHQWDYLAKVRLIRSFGVAIPDTLNAIVKARNLMEHHYQQPVVEILPEMVKAIVSFIDDTEFYVERFPVTVEYSNHLKQDLFGFYNLSLSVNRGEQCIYLMSVEGKAIVSGKDSQYVELLKRHLLKTKKMNMNL